MREFLWLLGAGFWALSSCAKYRDELAILPDGSGKIAFTIVFSESVLEQVRGGRDDGPAVDPAELDANEGIVAWTRPQEEVKDGWRTITLTAYFDDVNKVKIVRRGAKEPRMTFAWRRDGDGWVLEIDDRLVADPGAQPVPAEKRESTWSALQPLLRGFEVTRRASLPGAVTSAEGYAKKEGRAAWSTVVEAELKSLDDLEKLSAAVKRKVVCGKSELTEADVAAFRKELESAKAAWPAIREELRKRK